jgi:hypothetical protein
LNKILFRNSFPDHEGNPGHVGGSIARDAAGQVEIKDPPWGRNAQMFDGEIVVQGKFETNKDKWAVVMDDGKMAGNWNDTPEAAVMEARKFESDAKDYAEYKRVRNAALGRAKASKDISADDMVTLTGRKTGILGRNRAEGILREMGLRWKDANNILDHRVANVGLNNEGYPLYDFWQVLEAYHAGGVKQNSFTSALNKILGLNTFEGHRGRKGIGVGGSLARDAAETSTPNTVLDRIEWNQWKDDVLGLRGEDKSVQWSKLNETQRETLRRYVDGGYHNNQYIRKGALTDEDHFAHGQVKEYVAGMDSIFNERKPGAPRDMLVYRGMGLDGHHYEEQQVIEFMNGWQPGEKGFFIDPAYFSTTVSLDNTVSFAQHGEEMNVFFEIDVPKGSTCFPVLEDGLGYEGEVIFPRNAKFEVLNVRDYDRKTDGDKYSVRFNKIVRMRVVE